MDPLAAWRRPVGRRSNRGVDASVSVSVAEHLAAGTVLRDERAKCGIAPAVAKRSLQRAPHRCPAPSEAPRLVGLAGWVRGGAVDVRRLGCLLYTSDAADDLLC